MGFCNIAKNYPAFNYGHTITNANKYINFSEDGGVTQLTGLIDIGSYTLTKYVDLVAKAMNSVSGQEYTVTIDRVTRRLTISSVANFQLLLASGNNISFSAYNMMGFDGVADLTGSNTYTSTIGSGSQYVLQTPMANFSDFPRNKEKAESTVYSTPNGIVETISYGVIERMLCDFPLITDIVPQRHIRESLTGVQEFEDFIDYATCKYPLEFIYEASDPNTFAVCILDKTKSNKDGVGRRLVERIKDKLPGYYEMKGLTFRKIEER